MDPSTAWHSIPLKQIILCQKFYEMLHHIGWPVILIQSACSSTVLSCHLFLHLASPVLLHKLFLQCSWLGWSKRCASYRTCKHTVTLQEHLLCWKLVKPADISSEQVTKQLGCHLSFCKLPPEVVLPFQNLGVWVTFCTTLKATLHHKLPSFTTINFP